MEINETIKCSLDNILFFIALHLSIYILQPEVKFFIRKTNECLQHSLQIINIDNNKQFLKLPEMYL